MEKIKMVQYGCGKMSKYILRYAFEKNVEVIGAFDIDKNKIGKDLCQILGEKPCNVKILHPSEFVDFCKTKKPDIVVITTMSLISDIYEVLKECATLGINAITTCEEAFYPENSNPKIFNEIHSLAKANNCTICGSGYQDVFWGNMITAVCGATHKITRIVGKSSYNVEDYGIALARAHGAGLSEDEFEKDVASSDNISMEERKKLIDSGKFLPSYMWNVNGWLCSKLGLTVKEQTQQCVPHIARNKIYSSTLGITIPKGFCTGMSAVVTTKTEEGVEIVSECIGKVYDKNDRDFNEWEVHGEPDTKFTVVVPKTVELTCATIVNRIPDVINSPSGYYTTEKMPLNSYRNENLEEYVER